MAGHVASTLPASRRRWVITDVSQLGEIFTMSGSISAAFCAAPVTRPISNRKPVELLVRKRGTRQLGIWTGTTSGTVPDLDSFRGCAALFVHQRPGECTLPGRFFTCRFLFISLSFECLLRLFHGAEASDRTPVSRAGSSHLPMQVFLVAATLFFLFHKSLFLFPPEG